MSLNHYNALVSPDAYEYLDEVPENEFTPEPEENDDDAASDIYDDLDCETAEESDDSDLYAHASLFDEADEHEISQASPDEEVEETQSHETDSQGTDSALIFSDDEDDGIAVSVGPSSGETNDLVARVVALCDDDFVRDFLLQMDRPRQDNLASAIEDALYGLRRDHKDKMFVVPGSSVSVAVLTLSDDPMILMQRLANVGAVMVSYGCEKWNAIFIYFDENARMVRAENRPVSRSCFGDWEWKTVVSVGERLRANRK